MIFAIGISVLCGILFGLAPALEIPRAGLLSGVRIRGPVRGVFRPALVVAQIAASLLLLSGATLLGRSLWKMERVPLGIEPDHVLTAKITLSKERYPQPARQAVFFQQIESRLRSSRWVSAFALTDSAPPSGGMGGVAGSSLEIEGRTSAESLSGAVGFRRITPDYFRALEIPIVQGRVFNERDRGAADAVILSRTLAHRIFHGLYPLGRRVRFGAQNPWLTVIGVAADVKNGGFKYRDEPEFYVVQKRLLGDIGRSAIVIVRTTTPENAAAELLRAEIAALDPTLPVTVETMRQRVSKLTDGARFNAVLLGLFAATGALLAAIGLYGVVSFLVAERTAEFGVRVALGATPPAIARLVLSRAARWAALGGAIGFAGSLATTPLL
ncbi:MAG: ABC transporter permease, partial [bacterium]